MFSLMWSEHCGYKHSKKLLRLLPTEGPHVVMGPGENAGAVDVGDGLAVAFKVESHNHPSAVEPFQGAATGVGGILRDVFAIGARPIAILDSLRFGELDSARSRYLLDHAVAGIGHYGNSIGVPTVGGEVYFEGPYEQNCLVNAMCLGIAPKDKMIRSAAAGVGNVIVLFGALTGRDGIGGASVLASAELGEDEDKRPSVQIGDPFEEKKLLESSLELLDKGLLASLQDLGAAGLTSSSSEMASKGEVGIEIDVDKVPLREAAMEPFEVMISESQERMLCVVEPDKLDAVFAVCEKWEVRATAIGTVTDTRRLVVRAAARWWATCRSRRWSTTARSTTSSRSHRPRRSIRPAAGAPVGRAPRMPAGSARLAEPRSRRPLFEQYDWIVQSRTVRRPEEADAAVLMLEPDGGTGAIAVSIDGNGRRVACDPYTGAIEAVLECAANLACAGAEPLGLTNCLNFGNPEKPHVAWQLSESVRGLADACRALEVPVVGGNVSLYNEAPDGPIYPTPVVGMVGRLPDAAATAPLGFAGEGDAIGFCGEFHGELAGSGWPSCAASRCRTACPCPMLRRSEPLRRPCALQSARASWRAATTSPKADSWWRWPSRAWPAALAPPSNAPTRTLCAGYSARRRGRVRGLRLARGARAARGAHSDDAVRHGGRGGTPGHGQGRLLGQPRRAAAGSREPGRRFPRLASARSS